VRPCLLALLLCAGCAGDPEPQPVELSPLGERPPAEASPPEADPPPLASNDEGPADPAPPTPSEPPAAGPAWIEAGAEHDQAPSDRLAAVLEPLRTEFGVEGIVLQGSLATRYDGAKFFGKVQAHNYHALFDLTLVLPGGEQRTLKLKHSWGRLPKHATQEEVRAVFAEDVALALEAWVFGFPEVQALADDPEALAERAEASRQGLLERLRDRLPRGRLATAARGWGER